MEEKIHQHVAKQQPQWREAPLWGAPKERSSFCCYMLADSWYALGVLCTNNSVHQDLSSPLWAQSGCGASTIRIFPVCAIHILPVRPIHIFPVCMGDNV